MSGTGKIVRIGKLQVGRRRILQGAGVATVALTAPSYWRKLSAQEKRIIIRDPGGPYAEGFTEAFHKPFKAATGIESVGVAGQHEPTSLIKAMVETKNYTWDMALLTGAAADQLWNDGKFVESLKGVTSPHIETLPAAKKKTKSKRR